MPTPDASPFIRWFAATTLAGICVAVAFNVVVDPYACARLIRLEGLNSSKPHEQPHARLRKPLDMWSGRYDGVALGASQVEIGMATDNEGLLARDLSLYNAGLSEERPFEQALLLKHAIEVGGIKFAIVSLDFLRYFGGGGQPKMLAADWTRWRGLEQYLRTIVSLRSLAHSLDTIVASRNGTPPASYYLPLGQLKMTSLQDPTISANYLALFNAVDHAYLNGVYDLLGAREISRPDHAALRQILSLARGSGVQLHFFITPSHARQAEIIELLGLDALYLEWEKELVCVLEQEAKQHGAKQAYPLWDFSGYNTVTTERVPPAGSAATMQWYFDPVHWSSETGRLIQDRIFGFSSERLKAVGDFGVRLSSENLEEHFRTRAMDRSRFRAAYPQVSEDLKALHQARPYGRRVPSVGFGPVDCDVPRRGP